MMMVMIIANEIITYLIQFNEREKGKYNNAQRLFILLSVINYWKLKIGRYREKRERLYVDFEC